jgi:hypothetical protein
MVGDSEHAVVVGGLLVESLHAVLRDFDHPRIGNLDPDGTPAEDDDLVTRLGAPAVVGSQAILAVGFASHVRAGVPTAVTGFEAAYQLCRRDRDETARAKAPNPEKRVCVDESHVEHRAILGGRAC